MTDVARNYAALVLLTILVAVAPLAVSESYYHGIMVFAALNCLQDSVSCQDMLARYPYTVPEKGSPK